MTVIFPGGEFLELILNRNKNNSLAGNIPVIKRSSFLMGRGGGRKGRREERG